MSLSTRIFYAYPAQPEHLRETIELAAMELNNSNACVVQTWPELAEAGTLLLSNITRAIDSAQAVACDMTGLNHNVLFELGYALGRNKHIWLSLSTAVPGASDNYRSFPYLRSIGYQQYLNSTHLASALRAAAPWNRNESPILDGILSASTNTAVPTLLYIKSPVDTDPSLRLTRTIEALWALDKLITDDPVEAPQQDLVTYAQQIHAADIVLAHLTPSHFHQAFNHNAKASLLAGIAHALGKRTAIFAQQSYNAPFDYQDILLTYANAQACQVLAAGWLDQHRQVVQDTYAIPVLRQSKTIRLTSLNVGQLIAENERAELPGYFVQTSAYINLMAGTHTIFIGRKGTGKTANLFAAHEDTLADPRNISCILKPVSYQLDALLAVTSQIADRAERGFMLESLWKYVIYSELTRSVVEGIRQRPSHVVNTSAEQALLDWTLSHAELIDDELQDRLDAVVATITRAADAQADTSFDRIRVSELLHAPLLRVIRQHLGQTLHDKHRVAIYIDNLDRNWTPSTPATPMAECLMALLEVVETILQEFRVPHYGSPAVMLSIAIFLRADIFAHIRRHVRERDKLTYERVSWEQTELLGRVVDERLVHSVNDQISASQVWAQFFVHSVAGVSTRTYLAQQVLPRPRDVIYLLRSAIGKAIDRGHTIVDANDIRDAIDEYSFYALESLIAEDDPEVSMLTDILLAFAGQRSSLSESEVFSTLRDAGVADGNLRRYRDLLCDLTFLGVRTSDGAYVYSEDEDRRAPLLRAARSSARPRRQRGRGKRKSRLPEGRDRTHDHAVFKINPVFYAALEIAGE